MNDLGTPTPLPPFIPPNTIQHVTISLTVAESIQYEPSQTHTSLALQPKLSIRVMPVVIHSNKQTNKPTKPHCTYEHSPHNNPITIFLLPNKAHQNKTHQNKYQSQNKSPKIIKIFHNQGRSQTRNPSTPTPISHFTHHAYLLHTPTIHRTAHAQTAASPSPYSDPHSQSSILHVLYLAHSAFALQVYMDCPSLLHILRTPILKNSKNVERVRLISRYI